MKIPTFLHAFIDDAAMDPAQGGSPVGAAIYQSEQLCDMARPGQILVLAPSVPHTVRASEASELLLNVQMVPGAGSQDEPPA